MRVKNLPTAVWPTLLAVALLAACGQRGPLYIPGKAGDPYYDRQNRGAAPGQTAPGQTPGQVTPGQSSPNQPAPNNNKPDERPRREEAS